MGLWASGWTSGEQERLNAEGHKSGGQNVPVMFGLQLPLTRKPWITFSNPCNKVRGTYIYKEVFAHPLLLCRYDAVDDNITVKGLFNWKEMNLWLSFNTNTSGTHLHWQIQMHRWLRCSGTNAVINFRPIVFHGPTSKSQLHGRTPTSHHHVRTPTSTVCLHGPKSTFNFKFSGPSLLDMTSFTLQPHFLSEVYYDNGNCHTLCARA